MLIQYKCRYRLTAAVPGMVSHIKLSKHRLANLGLTKKPPGVVTLSPGAVAGIYNMKGDNAG
jgi:hypothetical protein